MWHEKEEEVKEGEEREGKSRGASGRGFWGAARGREDRREGQSARDGPGRRPQGVGRGVP